MKIHQIAQCANNTNLELEERQKYWKIWRELSITLQNLRLYENACEGYRRQSTQENLLEDDRKWLSKEYSKACHAVGELKSRRFYLEQIPSFFEFEPIDEVIDPQLALPRLYREYNELVDKRLEGGTDPTIDGRIIYLAARIERIDPIAVEQNERAQNLSQKEEIRFKAIQEVGQTLEQLASGQISFDKARPIFERYMGSSQTIGARRN